MNSDPKQLRNVGRQPARLAPDRENYLLSIMDTTCRALEDGLQSLTLQNCKDVAEAWSAIFPGAIYDVTVRDTGEDGPECSVYIARPDGRTTGFTFEARGESGEARFAVERCDYFLSKEKLTVNGTSYSSGTVLRQLAHLQAANDKVTQHLIDQILLSQEVIEPDRKVTKLNLDEELRIFCAQQGLEGVPALPDWCRARGLSETDFFELLSAAAILRRARGRLADRQLSLKPSLRQDLDAVTYLQIPYRDEQEADELIRILSPDVAVQSLIEAPSDGHAFGVGQIVRCYAYECPLALRQAQLGETVRIRAGKGDCSVALVLRRRGLESEEAVDVALSRAFDDWLVGARSAAVIAWV